MALGKCTRCGDYGETQEHHYYPKRWFRSTHYKDVETLCSSCHFKADRITEEIDVLYEINSPMEAKYYTEVFKMKFLQFMNSCIKCEQPIGRKGSIKLLDRTYHMGCLMELLRGKNENSKMVSTNGNHNSMRS